MAISSQIFTTELQTTNNTFISRFIVTNITKSIPYNQVSSFIFADVVLFVLS